MTYDTKTEHRIELSRVEVFEILRNALVERGLDVPENADIHLTSSNANDPAIKRVACFRWDVRAQPGKDEPCCDDEPRAGGCS